MKDQGDNHLDRIEKKIDAMGKRLVAYDKNFDSIDKRLIAHDKEFKKIIDIIEHGFGAVAEDISSLATKEHALAIGTQVAGIERELRDIKRQLLFVADTTHKHDEDISEAFKRIAKIEKHLEILTK